MDKVIIIQNFFSGRSSHLCSRGPSAASPRGTSRPLPRRPRTAPAQNVDDLNHVRHLLHIFEDHQGKDADQESGK